jgi:hypothetical protein
MFKHEPECLAVLRQSDLEYDAWTGRWPAWCRNCGGTGEISWTENLSPHGSGYYWPYPFVDLCPFCWEQGRCPRCFSFVSLEWNGHGEPEVCPFCGWNPEGIEGDDALPWRPECLCWMRDH